MRKRLRERFVQEIKRLLVQAGAEPIGEDFVLQTKAGRLTLRPSENRSEGLGTVFCRFDDPQTAKELVDCNPYSGKWNFHFFNGWSLAAALHHFAFSLAKVMP